MSRTTLGILMAILIISIAGFAMIRQQQARLREDRDALRAALTRFSAESEHLSNLVMQTRVEQASTHNQIQELAKVQTEITELRLQDRANQAQWKLMVQSASNQLNELAAIRDDMGLLGEEIGMMRDALQELYTDQTLPELDLEPEDETAAVEDPRPDPESRRGASMSIRIINTHEDFAAKLKHTANASEGESFQEVFGRFLEGHGIDLSEVAGLVFVENSGRVIVRAPRSTLESIERLTVLLDASE